MALVNYLNGGTGERLPLWRGTALDDALKESAARLKASEDAYKAAKARREEPL